MSNIQWLEGSLSQLGQEVSENFTSVLENNDASLYVDFEDEEIQINRYAAAYMFLSKFKVSYVEVDSRINLSHKQVLAMLTERFFDFEKEFKSYKHYARKIEVSGYCTVTKMKQG